MQSSKTLVGRDEMDRLVQMRSDVERYENVTIPALLQQVVLVRQALVQYGGHKSFCAATQQSDASCTCGLEAAIEDSRTNVLTVIPTAVPPKRKGYQPE